MMQRDDVRTISHLDLWSVSLVEDGFGVAGLATFTEDEGHAQG